MSRKIYVHSIPDLKNGGSASITAFVNGDGIVTSTIVMAHEIKSDGKELASFVSHEVMPDAHHTEAASSMVGSHIIQHPAFIQLVAPSVA